MIALDAVAAWHMRQKGWEPEEWLARLRRHDAGQEDGRAWISWRQQPDLPPGGQWFSRLELIVHEGGAGNLRFDPIEIGTARYMQDQSDGKGPKTGALMLRGPLPETLVAAMPGRRVSEVVDFEPLRDTAIIEAHNVEIATRWFTVIAVEPVREAIATPQALLP